MHWIILVIAGLFETAFAFCLGMVHRTTGMEARMWFGGFLICLAMSMLLLVKATQTIPIGTAYAVWTGLGAAGTVIAGMLFFKEPAETWRIFFLSTLILSIAGLKFVSNN